MGTKTRPLQTLGLGGDGDEVDGINRVEGHFGVSLNYADAPNWRTAGDVFASLLKAMPDQRDRREMWRTFAAILCHETGADPSRVKPETLLLAFPLRTSVGTRLRELFGSR